MTDVSANQGNEEAFRIAMSRFLLTARTFMPGIVDSAPKKVGRFWCVDVVPAIRRVIKDGEGGTRTKTDEKIAGVPIYVAGSVGAGLTITVPVNIGDNCLLAICDRGIDNWQLANGPQDPPELAEIRHHDITDAICIPLGSTIEAIDTYDTEAIQIRDSSSETVFSVKSGEIKAAVGSGIATLTDGLLNIIANVSIQGDFETAGTFKNNGVDVGSAHAHIGSPTAPVGPITPTGTPVVVP